MLRRKIDAETRRRDLPSMRQRLERDMKHARIRLLPESRRLGR